MRDRHLIFSIMVGSSLDGCDLALIEISGNDHLSYRFLHTEECTIPPDWQVYIRQNRDQAETASEDLQHNEFVKYVAKTIDNICGDWFSKSELVVYHGPTLIHDPSRKISTFLGDPSYLAELLGRPVLSDLRSRDLLLGGQGAPFAPLVDQYFFNTYDMVVNLGGIVNVSFPKIRPIMGCDLCGGNQVLNYLAQSLGLQYDDKGNIAKGGKLHNQLLDRLAGWSYLSQKAPKSLSNHQVFRQWLHAVDGINIDLADALHTYCQHISRELINASSAHDNILLTGGGAYNDFLISLLRTDAPDRSWNVPEVNTVKYKECLLLTLMGFLFLIKKPNAPWQATGAKRPYIAGKLFEPNTV